MKLLVLIGFLLPRLTYASSLVIISDIDDTVKITNVQDTGDAVGNISSKDTFVGMSHLYSSLLNQNEPSQIFYVTGQPSLLQNAAVEFLLETGLYLGAKITTNSGSADVLTYKVAAIKKIMSSISQDVDVVLVGDDTQKDPLVYEKIAKEFAQVKARYIRRVKNDSVLPEGSSHFETPLDIAVSEFNQNRISESALNRLSLEILTEKKRKRFFIKTTKCLKVLPGEAMANQSNLSTATKLLIAEAYKHTKNICNQ